MNAKKTPQKPKKKATPAKKSTKSNNRYFDFYDDIKINGRDIEW